MLLSVLFIVSVNIGPPLGKPPGPGLASFVFTVPRILYPGAGQTRGGGSLLLKFLHFRILLHSGGTGSYHIHKAPVHRPDTNRRGYPAGYRACVGVGGIAQAYGRGFLDTESSVFAPSNNRSKPVCAFMIVLERVLVNSTNRLLIRFVYLHKYTNGKL